MQNYIEELKVAIRYLHGGEATHVESVPVTKTFQGKTVWEGIVEVFDLRAHELACGKWRLSTIGADDERLGNNQTDGNLMFPNQVAEFVLQSMARISENRRPFAF
jgi:hypothetical protein